jgi:hypothetical protein
MFGLPGGWECVLLCGVPLLGALTVALVVLLVRRLR